MNKPFKIYAIHQGDDDRNRGIEYEEKDFKYWQEKGIERFGADWSVMNRAIVETADEHGLDVRTCHNKEVLSAIAYKVLDLCNTKLNKEHIYVLIQALDLYKRIGIGQLEEAIHLTADAYNNQAWDVIDLPEYNVVKQKLLGFGRHASHSIASKKVPQTFREAYNLEGELRNALNAGSSSLLKLSELPNVEIREIK